MTTRRKSLIGVAVALVLVASAAGFVLSSTGPSGTSKRTTQAAVRTTTSSSNELPADAQPLPPSHARAVQPQSGEVQQGNGAPDKQSPEYLAAHPPKSRAPTDAEIKAELDRYRKFRASIDPRQFDNKLLPNNVLTQVTGWQTSVASVFTDFGLPIACPVNGGILHRDDLGVANKTLPCGTMVTFRYNGKGIRVPVIDRGPYIEGREWDLTGATAVALNFPGLGNIDWKLG
jgi:rare lipoprotein A (RlpA)-like double-psi beta-barrel protein